MEQGVHRHDYKQMLWLSCPVFFEIMLRTLLGNIDQFMLSRYSAVAVAAVGNANQILNMMLIVLNVVCVASTIIIVQCIGSEKTEELSEIYTLSIALNVTFSVILSGIVFFRTPVLRGLKLPGELIQDTEIYFTVVSACFILQGIFMSLSAIFRSNSMMKEIMMISMFSNVFNVFGNLLFINGFGMIPALGVLGAALSTVLSLFVSVGLISFLYWKRIKVPLRLAYIKRPDIRKIAALFRLGIPAAGDSISYNTMQLVMMSFINRFGTVSSSVKAYVSMIVIFVYMGSAAIAQATQIKVGYAVGAGQVERAKWLVVRSVMTSSALSFGFAFLLYQNSWTVFSIFTEEERILELVKMVLLVDLFLEVGRGVNMVMINALLAAGDTRFPVLCAVISMWLIAVPVGYGLGVVMDMGIVGVWIGFALDEWCRAAAFILRWRGDRWQKKKIVFT